MKQTNATFSEKKNVTWNFILPASPLGSKPASGKRSDILFVAVFLLRSTKCAKEAAQLTIGRSKIEILPDPNKNAAKLSNAVNTNLRDVGSHDSWPIQ